MRLLRWAPFAAAIALTGSLFVNAPALAAAPKVVSKISVDKSEKVSPGDVLTYTIHVANEGDGLAKDLVLMDPIPKGTAFVPGSAESALASPQYSVDGGKTWHALPLLASTDNGKSWRPAAAGDHSVVAAKRKELLSGEVVTQGGKSFRAAPSKRYTHVRWVLSKLAPGAKAAVSVKVKVL